MLKFWYDLQVAYTNFYKNMSVIFYICYPINNHEITESQLRMVIQILSFCNVTLFWVILPHPFKLNIQL